MKRKIFFMVAFVFFVGITNAKKGEQPNNLSFEEFTVCGDYATAIATFAQLAFEANYDVAWFNAYGECIEKYY
ncbi:hypothetical protein LCL86_07285 [Muricauda ruestringensis]|nr:hypothetical protein [Allomuricauda ruestringensis]MCA0958836.1 hypothetical protein [Allomuricauda ruestringensis]